MINQLYKMDLNLISGNDKTITPLCDYRYHWLEKKDDAISVLVLLTNYTISPVSIITDEDI